MGHSIEKQVKEQPLTKAQSKAQFEEVTEELGLLHSFDFDEAWDIGLEIRRRKEVNDRRREKISRKYGFKSCLKYLRIN